MGKIHKIRPERQIVFTMLKNKPSAKFSLPIVYLNEIVIWQFIDLSYLKYYDLMWISMFIYLRNNY